MSAQIIPFVKPPAGGEACPSSAVPGTLDTALDVHGLIVKGFSDTRRGDEVAAGACGGCRRSLRGGNRGGS